MAVAGMLALSSCSNDDDQIVENAPQQMTFTAGYGDAGQTRTTLDTSMKKVSFDAGDEISILSALNANAKFTTAEGGATATFTGSAVDDAKYYAVYPYTDGLALSGTTITGLTIPTTQWNDKWATKSGKGWDPKAPIAYAVTEDANLQFHNLCAILIIRIMTGKYGKVTIWADQPLAGTFSLDTATGTLTATEGSNVVTAGDGTTHNVSFDSKIMYIAIAPGTYTNFTVCAEDMSIEKCDIKTKGSSATFEAGKKYNLGVFETFTDIHGNPPHVAA